MSLPQLPAPPDASKCRLEVSSSRSHTGQDPAPVLPQFTAGLRQPLPFPGLCLPCSGMGTAASDGPFGWDLATGAQLGRRKSYKSNGDGGGGQGPPCHNPVFYPQNSQEEAVGQSVEELSAPDRKACRCFPVSKVRTSPCPDYCAPQVPAYAGLSSQPLALTPARGAGDSVVGGETGARRGGSEARVPGALGSGRDPTPARRLPGEKQPSVCPEHPSNPLGAAKRRLPGTF